MIQQQPPQTVASRFGSIFNRLKGTENLLFLMGTCLVVSFVFNIFFLYKVAYQMKDLTRNLSLLPEVFKEIMTNLKGDLDTTLKPLNQNLTIIKDTVSNANLQEFQANMSVKLDQVSQAAVNIKNLAEKESLNNLSNRVEGMKEALSKNLDAIYASVTTNDTAKIVKGLEQQLRNQSEQNQARFEKLENAIRSMDLQSLEDNLSRRINLVSSNMVEKMQKLQQAAEQCNKQNNPIFKPAQAQDSKK